MASDQALMKSSDAARSLLLTRPWWNLCFVHGDQTKYYRQLYGKRTQIRRLQHLKQQQVEEEEKCAKCGEKVSHYTYYQTVQQIHNDVLRCSWS